MNPHVTQKLHPGELDISADLVHHLLETQFAQWTTLPLRPITSSGTDSALYRLGDALMVRLPRLASAVAQIERDARLLPVLAPHLPLEISMCIAQGAPDALYRLPWGVYTWLEGTDAFESPVRDEPEAARAIAGFIQALQACAPLAEFPVHNEIPLERSNTFVRETIHALETEFDAAALTWAWDAALEVGAWTGQAQLIHADLHPGNLLVRDGQVVAVIDFGGLGLGNPAWEYGRAWNTFGATARETLCGALDIDDKTWTRARGCALLKALQAYPYYRHTNRLQFAISGHTLREIVTEFERMR